MKSYLKFLSRNKLYTAIEAVGLAVSLAFVILIGSYVVQQYEVAHESPQWKRTFVLGTNEFLGLTYWDKRRSTRQPMWPCCGSRSSARVTNCSSAPAWRPMPTSSRCFRSTIW